MRKYSLNDFTKGWIVGDFSPSLHKNPHVEVSVKKFKAGDVEKSHMQKISTEITIIVTGTIRLGDNYFLQNDVVDIPPLEFADFEAITDCDLVCIKFPSIASDKFEE